MKFGFYGANIAACATAAASRRIAQAAEAAGFESLWVMDHPILPSPMEPPSVIPPTFPILDPIPALAFLAAGTKTIKLATGIVILPQRNPVLLAKQLASVDVLSEGRLIVGAGVGYIPREYEALGVPFRERGRRMDEGIDVIRTLWRDEQPAFSGELFHVARVEAWPRPVQRPCPPIVIGGESPAALRRAIGRGNGWYGVHKSLADTREILGRLRALSAETQRPGELGPLEISITPPTDQEITPADVEAFADLGVHRLIQWPMPHVGDFDQQLRFVERSRRLIERFDPAA